MVFTTHGVVYAFYIGFRVQYTLQNDSYSLQIYQEACGEASDAEFSCVIKYPRGIYVLELHTTAQLVYQLLIGTLWLIIMQQLVR